MDNGTELKPNYAAAENLIGVDENYLSQLMAEAERLGSSFPLCSELLTRGMWTITSTKIIWLLAQSLRCWSQGGSTS